MAAFNGVGGDAAREPGGQRPIDLGRIALALRAAARPIALAVVAVTVLAFALAHIAAEHYRATARIVGETSATTSTTTTSDSTSDPRLLATNLALLTSQQVLGPAARRLPGETLGSLRAKVTATTASDADVIDVTAEDSNAESAAAIANAVANAFLIQRAANQRAAIARTRAALEGSIARLAKNPARAADVAALRSRLDELVVEDANVGGDLQLADPAQPPASAFAPRPARVAALAFFAALALAVLIVAVREQVVPARRARELEGLAGDDVPLLAALPAFPRTSIWDRGLELLAARAPSRLHAPLAEAVASRRRSQEARIERARTAREQGLRSLLAVTLMALPPGGRHVILVTSADAGPRSGRLAAGLARLLAQAGEKTLVLSSDLASPLLTDELGVESAPGLGLSRVLENARTGTAARVRTAPVPGLNTLRVLPGGGPPRDGVGLARPDAVDALFAALGEGDHRYVVVDAPALLAAAEARVVARRADAAILACPEKPGPNELRELRRVLEGLNVRVLGAVSLPESAAGERTAVARARAAQSPPVADGRELWAAAAGHDMAPGAEARAVLERLRAAERPLTFRELGAALDDTPLARVRLRLRQLVNAGEVVRRGSGRPDDPYVYGPREP